MERYKRLKEILKRDEIDIAILTSPCNVQYATGFEVPYYKTYMESTAMDSLMALAVIAPENDIRTLLVSDFYEKKVKRVKDLNEYRFFTNYSAFKEYDPLQAASSALRQYLSEFVSDNSKVTIGLEMQTCSAFIYQTLKDSFPSAKIVSVSAAMSHSRMIKTPSEIKALRRAAAVMDVAQNTLKEIARSERCLHMTEFDVWAEVQSKMNIFAQQEYLPFVGELVTGPATGLSDYPLGPTARTIEAGDAGIMDVCPRVNGYWADTTNSVVFYAERNEEQNKYFNSVRDAFDAALENLVPGKRCCDVEAAHRRAFEKHGMEPVAYLGHEIGLEVNETPRLTCYDKTVIEPGMVFCIEPQQYTGASGSTGVRLEKTILITEHGPEVLNQFNFGTY